MNGPLESMLYHRIARDSSFCNKLYPCAPIVRLVIFLLLLAIYLVLGKWQLLSHAKGHPNIPLLWAWGPLPFYSYPQWATVYVASCISFCQTPILGLGVGVGFTFAPLHISLATFALLPGNLYTSPRQPLHISLATFAHLPDNLLHISPATQSNI